MNKKGFTLIEIIIVIVILGVLATLSLPRLTAQIDASESAEAMQFFGMVKRAAMSCYDSAGTFQGCATSGSLGVGVPASGKFIYGQSIPTTDAVVTWWAKATRSTHAIMMQLDNTGTTRFAASASSPFNGIVNKTMSTTAFVAVPAAIATANSF